MNKTLKQVMSKYFLFGSLRHSCEYFLYSSSQLPNPQPTQPKQPENKKKHQNQQTLICRRGFLIQGLWCASWGRKAKVVHKRSLEESGQASIFFGASGRRPGSDKTLRLLHGVLLCAALLCGVLCCTAAACAASLPDLRRSAAGLARRWRWHRGPQ